MKRLLKFFSYYLKKELSIEEISSNSRQCLNSVNIDFFLFFLITKLFDISDIIFLKTNSEVCEKIAEILFSLFKKRALNREDIEQLTPVMKFF